MPPSAKPRVDAAIAQVTSDTKIGMLAAVHHNAGEGKYAAVCERGDFTRSVVAEIRDVVRRDPRLQLGRDGRAQNRSDRRTRESP